MYITVGPFPPTNMGHEPQRVAHEPTNRIRMGLRELEVVGADGLIAILRDTQRPKAARLRALSLLSAMDTAGDLPGPAKRRAVAALPSLFWEGNPALAWAAGTFLGVRGGKAASAQLRRVVRSRLRSEIRRAAVYALGMLGTQGASGDLTRVLRNRREPARMRAEAAEALATCGCRSKRAILSLIEALGDRSPGVRFFSAYALGISALCQPRLRAEMRAAATALQGLLGDRARLGRYGTVAHEAEDALHHIQSRARDGSPRQQVARTR